VKHRGAVLVGSLALLAAVLASAGCGGGGSGGKDSIILYNGQHLALTTALISAFEKKTGIAVRVRTNDSVVLADQILQEGSASPADVYLAENSPELMNLSEKGVLTPLPSSALGGIPARYRSPKGDWAGVALRVSSLVYNPSKLARGELPASVLDLAKPDWKGKVAIAPLDSDFPPIVGAVIARHGVKAATEWVAGLKRNAEVYQDEEAVVAAVNRGDVASGLINQYYWYRLRLESGSGAMRSRLYYFPHDDVGSVVNVSGAGVLASSKHKAEAEQFIEFLTSRSAQQLIGRTDDFEYPALPGVAPNPALPPLALVPHAGVSVVALGDDRQAATLVANGGFGS
jgi:iron(III) transport system substrate-binding protein